MDRTTLIVDRPPQPLLRKKAREAGKSPEKFLQDLLLEHGSQTLAAEAVDVCDNTFSRWCSRMKIGIRRERAA